MPRLKFKQREMPAQMAVERPIARIGGEPGGQKVAAGVQITALVTNMREPVCGMRVLPVEYHGALDLRPGGRDLSILGQCRAMVGEEPVSLAVMRGEAVHQCCDLMLLSDTAGTTNQAIRVRGSRDQKRVARPCHQMLLQGGDCGVGTARECEVEESDVTDLAFRQTGGCILGCRQGCPRRRSLAFAHEDLSLAGMGQGESGVGTEGTVKGLDRAWIESQRQTVALNVGIPSGGGGD